MSAHRLSRVHSLINLLARRVGIAGPIDIAKSDMKEGRWCPDECPITGMRFFMWIDHPDLGYVPTYGGPFDSYTIAEPDEDGVYRAERFDHDEGSWVDGGEPVHVRDELTVTAEIDTPETESVVVAPIAVLKGIGRIDGDGWKDVTKKGEEVFVWNTELPKPYTPGQYPRIGNEGWSASTRQYDFTPATVAEVRSLFAANAASSQVAHFDDRAVDEFARLMKQKMAASREKGRYGWDDPDGCSVEDLSEMLHQHVAKGDPVDVANFCMMLRHYDAKIAAHAQVSIVPADSIRALITAHAEQLGQNDYAYFELAYTRHTSWMAWLCSNSRDDDPGRKVLAKGQGDSPEAACEAALASMGGEPT